MIRFASLGSGSKGNATLVSGGGTSILVDCGFSMKEAIRRMERLEFNPADLSAIVVTHEHGDHGKGVMALGRKLKLPVHMSAGTAVGLKALGQPEVSTINVHERFAIGALQVFPVAVPHDARESCQFVFCCDDIRVGLLTDLGHVTPHIRHAYQDVDALILEANHDRQMLADGPYPESLKQRVGGQFGHLSNEQSAGLLADLNHDRLQQVVISHISEHNNHPEVAASVLAAAMPGHEDKLCINTQDTGFDWCQINRLEDIR